jgi:hypothetical protein
MAEQDELQIRVGLSVAGAEKVQTTARAAETKTKAVSERVRQLDTEIKLAETRARAIQKGVLRMGVAFGVGSLLETGVDALIPTDNQNAISALARIGKGVAVPALMSPNPVGITLALLNGAITAIQEDIRILDEHIKRDRDEVLEFRGRFDKQTQDFRDKLGAITEKADERIEGLVKRGYLELRSGL